MRRASSRRAYKPSVRAPIAGGKTSPAIETIVLATATGQNRGNAKIATAPADITASARTMAPRLERVTSIAAPIGVCTDSPSKPLTVVTIPTSAWLQCCWVTRKTFR